MSQRFLLDISPTGVEHYCEIDPDGRELTLIEHTPTRIEDVILDDCKRLRSLHQRRSNFQLAAKVPINTHAAWKREWREDYREIYTWPTFLAMKLNSRDNCDLRVGSGRGVWGKKL